MKMHTRQRTCLLPALLAGLGMALPAFGQNSSAALEGAIAIKSQEAVVDVPLRKLEHSVTWMVKPIQIDGDKADWIANGVKPVRLAGNQHATWFKGTYGGESDLAANVWLGRDFENLYVGIEIEDDQLPVPNRFELAFTDANTPLIAGWQDVGMRYKADDAHAVFVINPDGSVGLHWAHLQKRMDHTVVQDSYGSEAERRALLEHGGSQDAASYKIFTKASTKVQNGRSTTFVEVALPWRMLLPFDPVKGNPIKMNIAVHDRDGDGLDQVNGVIGWLPGLVGTYSGAHFPTLTFEPPHGRSGIDAFAQVPNFHYLKRDIKADVSLLNNGPETPGKLQLLAVPGKAAPLAEIDLTVPSGTSSASLSVDSEAVSQSRLALMGRFIPATGETITFPVFAPRSSNEISVQHVAEIEARITELEKNYVTLSNLYARVEKAGYDTAYPKAYLTLLEMFIPRCRLDLDRGDSDRVIRNTAHLESIYKEATVLMKETLKNPQAQLKPPARFNPETLKIKDGYWYDGDKPVFLWGPCVFWFLKQDAPLVADLGFNSIAPEVSRKDSDYDEVVEHMAFWRENGFHVNANLSVPDLQLTGADVRASKLLQEHPELKNLDPNNFLSFVIQHPIVREKIAEGYANSVKFWKNFKGINSYWLWNEPWYLNYSEMTRKDFIAQYLKPKYQTVEALNKRWKSNYKNFDDVQLIQWPNPNNYAPWYDFQQFRDDLLVDFFGFLSKTSKALNPSMPTHTKFMAASLHSFNIERLQSVYDIMGHDGSAGDRDILFLDFCQSIYPDRPLSDTEVHIFYGGKTHVELVAWRLALHGLANGNWWCWHSNQSFSDSLGNAESMHALAISGLDIQRIFYPHMTALVKKDKPIATLFPDVVERRSDVKMVRMRFEVAVAQYMLGLQPFYATEARIAEGELDQHEYLFAGESAFVKEATYASVLEFVKKGGTLIVTKGGFAQNEYGDPRDASELVKAEGGEAYGDFARIYPVGTGKVICIDEISMLEDPVLDGGICMRGSPTMENDARRRIYFKVLEKFVADNAIDSAVRLVPTEAVADDPDAMVGYDWRAVKIGDAYTLAVLPYGAKAPFDVTLQTERPIRKIVDLITGKEIPVKEFAIQAGPNLFSIELKK